MASIILTGATGTAGSDALRQAIKSPWIAQITVLSRRALPDADLQNHPKVNFIEHTDFLHYPHELLKRLKGHSACIWDLGITSVGIKEEAYRRITTEYAVEAAKAFSSLTDGNPESFSFVYLSGQGAAWRPGFLTQMFGKVKGEAELALSKLPGEGYPALRVHSVRPAFIHPSNPKPDLPFAMRAMAGTVNAGIAPRSLYIKSADLGDAMIKIALPQGEQELATVGRKGGQDESGVWSNQELWKLVGK